MRARVAAVEGSYPYTVLGRTALLSQDGGGDPLAGVVGCAVIRRSVAGDGCAGMAEACYANDPATGVLAGGP